MIKDEVLKSFNKKNVLVTGGTGLIGRQIVDMLIDAGATVCVASLDKIVLNPKAEMLHYDLTDFKACLSLCSGMDYVFHVAGVKGSIEVTRSKPASFFVPILQMNTNILEAARRQKVEKLVYTSSIGAYSSAEVFKEDENLEGPPMDEYPGLAKRIAEKQIEAYVIQYGMDNFSIVRPCNVYGPGDNFDPNNAMVIPSLMNRIFNKEDPVKVWGDGSAIRDFAYSRDVAEGIILALHHGTNGKFVNLGSGNGYSIGYLMATLYVFIDFKYEFDTSKSSGFPRRIMDISLAKKLIDYNPTTTLLSGLKKTWNWYIENTDEYLKKKNYFAEDSND